MDCGLREDCSVGWTPKKASQEVATSIDPSSNPVSSADYVQEERQGTNAAYWSVPGKAIRQGHRTVATGWRPELLTQGVRNGLPGGHIAPREA